MSKAPSIRIKLIVRGQPGFVFQPQLPETGSFTGECSFLFDLNERSYDWLVVIDDVSRSLQAPPETLACADEHTMLLTTEPPSITNYGNAFSSQFSHVITSQPEKDLPHPGRIYSHTGNLWFNGHSYQELNGQPFPEKSSDLSVICSSKQQKHTLHNDRYAFCHWLTEKIDQAKLFGAGHSYIQHKYDALDPYRYTVAIESYSGPHHWTEKLADPYLSGTFPIYYGCTNVADYFPEGSYLEIDLYQREEALEKIRSVIENPNHYSSSLDALYEARRRVLHEYNLLHMIETTVLAHYQPENKASNRPLYGRKQMRYRNPMDGLRHLKFGIMKHLKA